MQKRKEITFAKRTISYDGVNKNQDVFYGDRKIGTLTWNKEDKYTGTFEFVTFLDSKIKVEGWEDHGTTLQDRCRHLLLEIMVLFK